MSRKESGYVINVNGKKNQMMPSMTGIVLIYVDTHPLGTQCWIQCDGEVESKDGNTGRKTKLTKIECLHFFGDANPRWSKFFRGDKVSPDELSKNSTTECI